MPKELHAVPPRKKFHHRPRSGGRIRPPRKAQRARDRNREAPDECVRAYAISPVAADRRLRNQQQLPCRLSSFQIAMRPLRLGQRILVFDPQLEFARRHHAQHRARPRH